MPRCWRALAGKLRYPREPALIGGAEVLAPNLLTEVGKRRGKAVAGFGQLTFAGRPKEFRL